MATRRRTITQRRKRENIRSAINGRALKVRLENSKFSAGCTDSGDEGIFYDLRVPTVHSVWSIFELSSSIALITVTPILFTFNVLRLG